MATTYTDSKGAVWTIQYDAPSFAQLKPWQGYAPRYAEFPHLFAYTEEGLQADIASYAASHTPSTKPVPDTPTPTVDNDQYTDARGVVWNLHHTSLSPTWTGFTNSAAYGLPKPSFTADSKELLKLQITTYVVSHPLVTTKPPPGVVTTPPKPPTGTGGGPAVDPVVMPARKPKSAAGPVVAVAAVAAFALLLSRRG